MLLTQELISPLLDDARALADSGFASRADIDAAMRLGAGHPQGPFELMGEPATDTGADRGSAPEQLTRVSVIGTGTMARGIAEVLTRANISTVVVGRTTTAAELAVQSIADRLQRAVERDKLSAPQRTEMLDRLTPADDLAAIDDSELVIEAVVEELEVKRGLFARLQLAAPNVPLATNTSSYRVSDISTSIDQPERILALHFFNPAPAMQLVEVVGGAETDPDLVARGHAWARILGKQSVSCGDQPGFLVNRLLIPYLNDAARVTPASLEAWSAVDLTVRDELGHPMGPFELMDLIGLDVMVFALETMRLGLADERHAPSPSLRRLVAQGRLGRKSGSGFYEYAASR